MTTIENNLASSLSALATAKPGRTLKARAERSATLGLAENASRDVLRLSCMQALAAGDTWPEYERAVRKALEIPDDMTQKEARRVCKPFERVLNAWNYQANKLTPKARKPRAAKGASDADGEDANTAAVKGPSVDFSTRLHEWLRRSTPEEIAEALALTLTIPARRKVASLLDE